MNKFALITGASRGIGRGIAEVFAKNSVSVAVGYKNSTEKAEDTCECLGDTYSVRALPIQGDLMLKEDCERIIKTALDRFGSVDFLVNNAGEYCRNPSADERARMVMTKLNSVEFLTEFASRCGVVSIINISSFYAANHAGAQFSTAYQAGVESMTLYYAKRLKGRTRVNAIRPGFCATDMLLDNYSSEEVESMLKEVPDRSLIQPKEIGELVYFVAVNPLLTGQIITADKGATLGSLLT